MTQYELTLVLDALKFCHGGEPCGTAEAIAVVEKALANVATNDTSKERVDEMQKQRHEQEPVTTVEDNSQQWKGMDGAIAFHLIERHADGWNDIRKMMGEWLSANTPQRTEQEPVAYWKFNNGFSHCIIDQLNEAAKKNPAPLYTAPPQRIWVGLTKTEVVDLLCEYSKLTGNVGWQQLIYMTEAKLKEKNT